MSAIICISAGNATITNGIAVVIVNRLECEAMYTVVTNGVISDRIVEGSRLSNRTIATGACPVSVKSKSQLFCACIVTFSISLQ